MTDFRAELQALLAAIEDDRLFTTDSRRVQQAIDRARAALAEPEPEGPPPQAADGEVAELAASLERMSIEADAAMQLSDSEVLGRAAGLLERLSPPLP